MNTENMKNTYNNDPLGCRMKSYENNSRVYLERKQPVILRFDGKAFHTFTRGLKKPFDEILVKTMEDTMIKLCENIQGAKIGYHQSDEISILVTDWEKEKTGCWFKYGVQKMVSVGSAMATLYFNEAWNTNFRNISYNLPKEDIYLKTLGNKCFKAMFDCRAFTIPVLDIENYFIWREKDAIKNAISMVAHCYFSNKELHGVNSKDKIDMLNSVGINYADIPNRFRRGTCAIKKDTIIGEGKVRSKWILDYDIPDFREDRGYIGNRVVLTKFTKGE